MYSLTIYNFWPFWVYFRSTIWSPDLYYLTEVQQKIEFSCLYNHIPMSGQYRQSHTKLIGTFLSPLQYFLQLSLTGNKWRAMKISQSGDRESTKETIYLASFFRVVFIVSIARALSSLKSYTFGYMTWWKTSAAWRQAQRQTTRIACMINIGRNLEGAIRKGRQDK